MLQIKDPSINIGFHRPIVNAVYHLPFLIYYFYLFRVKVKILWAMMNKFLGFKITPQKKEYFFEKILF